MRRLLALLLLFSGPTSAALAQTTASLPSLSEPALSPDGNEIAFVSGGDIWTVDAGGGVAHLLISDPATESRPLYSPDGTQLAFVSTRTGAGDIYVLNFATGALRRITWSSTPDALSAWSQDGKWLYFTSSTDDVAGEGDIFRVSAGGGTPLEVSRERYVNEFEGAPSPDGSELALMARGISSSQWWRHGASHIDQTEVWTHSLSDGSYKRVLADEAKHGWPMWAPDGKSLYMMSDKGGPENLWRLSLGGAAAPVTHFKDGRVLWPSMGAHGRAIVVERNFAVWKYDAGSGKAEEVKITLRGVPSGAGLEHRNLSEWDDFALSPDGKKLAVIGHGEVFAAGSKDGGEGQRVTYTAAREQDPVWSQDSARLVYRSDRDGDDRLYSYDFGANKETELTHEAGEDSKAELSPDGKYLAYVHGRHELHVLTLDGMHDAVAVHAMFNNDALAWSPDSKWIAFVATGTDGFQNLHVVPPTGGEEHPITFLANGEVADGLAWAPNGAYILFATTQRSEPAKMARVDLTPHVPKYREDQFRDLFHKQSTPGEPELPGKPGAPPSTTPKTTPTPSTPVQPETAKDDAAKPEAKKTPPVTNITFAGIRDRLTFLPIGLSVDQPVISPDGKTLLFTAEIAGQDNLFSYSLDELAKEPPVARQLTATAKPKGAYAISPDSKTAYVLDGGQVQSIALGTEDAPPAHAKTIAITGSVDVDFDKEKEVVFSESWTGLNRTYYDPKFNGHDWAALRAAWQPYVAGARTGDELRRDINLMIGELNSSHSGIYKRDKPQIETGRLGLRWNREDFEAGHGLVVREVVPLGPADISGKIHVGDALLAVDGEAITPMTNFDQLMDEKVGKRVVLSIAPGADAAKKMDVVVRPVSTAVETGLLYRGWVESRRAYVDKISGGKLGYVHMADMSDAALQQLYTDLDAQNQAKEGVVVDVRNNDGGYVNGYAIDVFARKNYLQMTPRGEKTYPSRQLLGQRALGLPTVLVTNQSSLSDSEDFTEGYRALHLGPVVGTPTAGWIIFTGGEEMIDGSLTRHPMVRIDGIDGKPMEMHPRPVDVEVEDPLGETETGEDVQLKAAVHTLLQRIGSGEKQH